MFFLRRVSEWPCRVLSLPRVLLTVASVGATQLTACQVEPQLEGHYVLEQVDGDPLPAPHLSFRMVDGERIEYRILRGLLAIYDDGTFVKERDQQEFVDDVGSKSWFLRARGRYTYRDSVLNDYTASILELRFREADIDQVYRYEIADSGRTLIGLETLGRGFEATYRYRRQ